MDEQTHAEAIYAEIARQREVHEAADICRQAVETWGEELQLRMLQEEAAEVIVAVSHMLRGRGGGAPEVAEDVADLEIMIGQLRAMGYGALIDQFKRKKLARLRERIEEATQWPS